MATTSARLPRLIVWVVIILSLLPSLVSFCGFSVTQQIDTLPTGSFSTIKVFLYILLEWTGFCVACSIAVFALFHYYLRESIPTAIIGTALLLSGMLDAFHVTAVIGMIQPVSPLRDFIPFTWMLSRCVNICVIFLGIFPFLFRNPKQKQSAIPGGAWFLLAAGFLFSLAAYSLIHICAHLELPQAYYGDQLIHRPWDVLPLVLYLVVGSLLLPRFLKVYPSVFSYGLMVSLIPHIFAELHAAFGSQELYDDHFYYASVLKVLAYFVPLIGLMIDYSRAYLSEAALQRSEAKLQVAREVQQGLLPRSTPDLDGIELAGFSIPANAVGGDYFDYVPMRDGRYGIVVADVSGHEMGAAIVMSQTRAYLRAQGASGVDARTMLQRLNRFLSHEVSSARFVCMLFVELNPVEKTFRFFSLGHSGQLIKADGSLQDFPHQCPPLGIADDDDLPDVTPLPFEPGDVLMLLTDGLMETESPHGEQYGINRAIERVTFHREESAQEILDDLQHTIEVFANHSPQVDDLTALIIKRVEDSVAEKIEPIEE